MVSIPLVLVIRILGLPPISISCGFFVIYITKSMYILIFRAWLYIQISIPFIQVMFSRSPARGGSSQQSSASRRQDREIRKLRGELQHESHKLQSIVTKYQRELEDMSFVSSDIIIML